MLSHIIAYGNNIHIVHSLFYFKGCFRYLEHYLFSGYNTVFKSHLDEFVFSLIFLFIHF